MVGGWTPSTIALTSLRQDAVAAKPEVGLIEMALDDFPVDMERSYLIGDSDKHDMELARRLGLRSFQVTEGARVRLGGR